MFLLLCSFEELNGIHGSSCKSLNVPVSLVHFITDQAIRVRPWASHGQEASLTVPISTQLYKRLGTSSGHTCTAVSVASCPRPARQASVRWVARLETRLHLYLQFFSLDGISVHPHYFICQFASELRQYSFSHALEWTKPRHKES